MTGEGPSAMLGFRCVAPERLQLRVRFYSLIHRLATKRSGGTLP